ncbi:hypothetical protein OC844_007552 [Tilletia horrida]|nr:hypothetical protein OC844_007552 [Tilletia horrida]
MSDLPSTVPDAVTDPKRLKLKHLSSTLHILVSVEPWTKEDAQMVPPLDRRSKEAASLDIDLQPGAGNALFSEEKRRRKPLNQVCASTAHLLNLQSVLELVLIFFGIQLESTKGLACDHAHGVSKKYCPLVPPSDKVSSIVFSRKPRPAPYGFAASTDFGDPFQDVTALQMCQPLWDFVEPVANEGCVVYVRLKARSQARPGLPHQLLRKLAQAFGILATEPEGADAAAKVPKTDSKKRKRDQVDQDAEGTRSVATSPALHIKNTSGTKSIAPKQPKTPTQQNFRSGLKERGVGEVCALLGEEAIVEAAHLLPKRIGEPKIAHRALQGVFDTQLEEPTPAQLHCMPLFSRQALPIPSKLDSMYDDKFLGLLLHVYLHNLLDQDCSLMILRGAAVVLGMPTSRDQLACFEPPCPTIQYNKEDKFGWKDMHQRQLQHEKEVKPRLGFDIPIQKWAALHLNAAISFFIQCMKNCDATQDLLVSVISDPDFTDEVIAPHGPAPASSERQNEAANTAANGGGTRSRAASSNAQAPGAVGGGADRMSALYAQNSSQTSSNTGSSSAGSAPSSSSAGSALSAFDTNPMPSASDPSDADTSPSSVHPSLPTVSPECSPTRKTEQAQPHPTAVNGQTEAELEAESITSDLIQQYRELEAAFEEDEDNDGREVLKFQDEIGAILALCMLATCAGSTRPATAATTSALCS